MTGLMKGTSRLKRVLTEEQFELFDLWCDMNNINRSTLEHTTDLKSGISVYGCDKKHGENWEIDFVYHCTDDVVDSVMDGEQNECQ